MSEFEDLRNSKKRRSSGAEPTPQEPPSEDMIDPELDDLGQPRSSATEANSSESNMADLPSEEPEVSLNGEPDPDHDGEAAPNSDGSTKRSFGEYQKTKKDGSARKSKATREQHNQVISTVERLLVKGEKKHVIKAVLSKTWNYSPRMADKFITLARKRMLKEIGIENKQNVAAEVYYRLRAIATEDETREELKDDGQGNQIVVIRPAIQPRDRIIADQAISALLGLNAPTKIDTNATVDVTNHIQMDELRQKMISDPVLRQLAIELSERLGGLQVPVIDVTPEATHVDTDAAERETSS